MPTIQTVKGSVFTTMDNLGYVSLADLVPADGITDAGPSILATLNAGNTLFIPVGTFICSPITLPANSQIFGTGAKSILKLINSGNSILLSAASRNLLKDFAVDGNKINQVISGSHGIQVTGSDVILQGIVASNCRGDGINLSGAGVSNALILNCYITGNTVNGIKVEQGTGISIINCISAVSDVLASGDGIAIASAGNAINSVIIQGCTSRNNAGRGLSLLGFGARNVTGISVVNCSIQSNAQHGLHMVNTENCSITAGLVTSNGQDGIRLEGDVQYTRISGAISRNNTTYGIREVTAGTTPNNNGFIYSLSRSNGTDAITKVGGSSFII